jgi:hypothetical protein
VQGRITGVSVPETGWAIGEIGLRLSQSLFHDPFITTLHQKASLISQKRFLILVNYELQPRGFFQSLSLVRLLPGELDIIAPEVTVCGSLAIDRAAQVEVLVDQREDVLLVCPCQRQAGRLGGLVSAVYDHHSNSVSIYLLKLP